MSYSWFDWPESGALDFENTLRTIQAVHKANWDSMGLRLDSVIEAVKYIWSDSVERGAETGMSEDDQGFQKDTLEVYKYVGSSWIFWYSIAPTTHIVDAAPIFDSSVENYDMVYYDGSKYWPAQAGIGAEEEQVIGVARTDLSQVIAVGFFDIGATLNPYGAQTDIYLSDILPGKITNILTDVPLGYSLGSGRILLLRGFGGGGSSGGTGITMEDIIYYDLLRNSNYEQCFYEAFAGLTTIDDTSSLTYSSYDGGSYSGTIGNYLQHQVLTQTIDGNENVYYKVKAHIEVDDEDNEGNITVQYRTSLSGGGFGSWQAISLDTDEVITVGYDNLEVLYTWTGTAQLNSFGIFYDEVIQGYVSEVRFYEQLVLTADVYAEELVTIPNNSRYTPDGKSLEIYYGRERLLFGASNDYIEDTAGRVITAKTTLLSGEVLTFIEKFGVVDNSVENYARTSKEHDPTGRHLSDFVEVTANYSVSSSDETTVICNPASSDITVVLPECAVVPGVIYTIKKISADYFVTLEGDGSETINGATGVVLKSQWQSCIVTNDGSNWFVLSESDRNDGLSGVAIITADYDARDDKVVICNATLAVDINLPPAADFSDKIYAIRNMSAFAVTVIPDGAETIDTKTSLGLGEGDHVIIASNGVNWIRISGNVLIDDTTGTGYRTGIVSGEFYFEEV